MAAPFQHGVSAARCDALDAAVADLSAEAARRVVANDRQTGMPQDR